MRVVTQTGTDPRTHTDARYMDTERLTDMAPCCNYVPSRKATRVVNEAL